LGSRRGEQFLSRLNAGYPPRRFRFAFCHDTFLGGDKYFVSKDSLKRRANTRG
jgi:hypothetical protein